MIGEGLPNGPAAVGGSGSGDPAASFPTQRSSPEAKIALFRSLFRGRDEVYPRRFESRRTGRAGYQPACGNEWVAGVCAKPRIKCSDCPHQRFLPVTDDVVRWHLSGRDPDGHPFVMGLYPMLLDETCHFLAVDFDGAGWGDDALAFLATCRRLEVPAALERSRSGEGGHVWMFFAEAVPATVARQLGCHVLTETMEARPEVGLRSYDRLFPNQDTLPKGGFGNLIALPLQWQARVRGNSVFVDHALVPHPDQWAFLASVRRMDRMQVGALVREADTRGRILGVRRAEPDPDADDPAPWLAAPCRRQRDGPIQGSLPARVELVLGDQIYIAKQGLNPGLRNRLLRIAAFQNPEFHKAQAMRLSSHGKPRVIACAEDLPQHLGLPRGCLEEVQGLLSGLRIGTVIRDERFAGRPLEVFFHGDLRPEQKLAAEALVKHDTGILAATTAFGKTILGAWLIAARKVNTLVLVHRQQLLEQWVERLSAFLDVPAKSIGRLGGGRRRLTGSLDVALMQSLVRRDIVDDRVADYGFIVVDECHHVSARSFELVVRRAKARFVTGLSATIARKNGHDPIILMQCGPVRYRVDAKRQAATRPFTHQVIVRSTGFRSAQAPDEDRRVEFQRLYAALTADEARNRLICGDVLACVAEGRSPLVLTERTDHLEGLAERLRPLVPGLIVLKGGMGRKTLREALERLGRFPDGAGRVLLATGGFIGEGFDDARLDTLFLTLPVSWRGTIAQYAGRLHRLHGEKREVRIHDYADLDIPMLARMFDRRCRGYEAVGYTILVPASALPGWPPEVLLPVDPAWKRDYAASVRRLVRDGVDAPLARLFADVARSPAPDATGADRARSATEAFLFRRLESLSETVGRFRLNAVLPIPFDGHGQMEVDLLDEGSGVAIEVDGPQHFSDVAAYRSDRRKDALLQEHGYHVLRFLAEDIGERLDEVLDMIRRALVHRQGRLMDQESSSRHPLHLQPTNG